MVYEEHFDEMRETYSFETLAKEIIARSVSSIWNEAKREWFLHHIVQLGPSDPFDECLCTHPIKELCFIQNKLNNNMAKVGNVCVNNFLGLESDVLFKSRKKLDHDNTKSASQELLNYALKRRFIDEWEFDFYKDKFVRFSSLSYKQQQMKIKINDNILRGMKKDDIYAEDTSAIDSKKLKKKVSIVHLKNKALKLKGKGYAGKKVIYVAIPKELDCYY